MPGTTLYGIDLGIRYQIKNIPSLEANVLDTQMACNLITDITQRLFKVGIEFALAVSKMKILKGVEESIFDLLDISVIRVH